MTAQSFDKPFLCVKHAIEAGYPYRLPDFEKVGKDRCLVCKPGRDY